MYQVRVATIVSQNLNWVQFYYTLCIFEAVASQLPPRPTAGVLSSVYTRRSCKCTHTLFLRHRTTYNWTSIVNVNVPPVHLLSVDVWPVPVKTAAY